MKAGTLVTIIMIIALIIGGKLLKPVATQVKEDNTIEEHTVIMANMESGWDARVKVVLEDGSVRYYHTNLIRIDTERDYSYTQRVGKYSPNIYLYLSKEDYKTIFGMKELEAGKEICHE